MRVSRVRGRFLTVAAPKRPDAAERRASGSGPNLKLKRSVLELHYRVWESGDSTMLIANILAGLVILCLLLSMVSEPPPADK
jgi:hypothetical protein